MVGVILTLVAIGLVSYFVIKNYYPPIILLLLGLLLLFCAYLEGVPAVAPKASTNFFAFDFAQAFTNLLKGRLPGLGLNIMAIAGFAVYMDRIGASKALVKLCVKPLKAIRSPYVLLALTYLVGQFIALFVNSAVGLGLLLMAYLSAAGRVGRFPHFCSCRYRHNLLLGLRTVQLQRHACCRPLQYGRCDLLRSRPRSCRALHDCLRCNRPLFRTALV